MITQVNLFDLMIAANWIFIKLKLERRMATSSKEQRPAAACRRRVSSLDFDLAVSPGSCCKVDGIFEAVEVSFELLKLATKCMKLPETRITHDIGTMV